MTSRSANMWDQVVGVSTTGAPAVVPSLQRQRSKLMDHWSQHPWNFIAGKDSGGRQLIWTTDEKDEVNPVKPFPYQKEYLAAYVDCLFRTKRVGSQAGVVLVNKCRQMIITWTTLLYAYWVCAFQESRSVLLSKNIEDESKKLLRDKVRAIQPRLPLWVQERIPITTTPMKLVTFLETKSFIQAVSESAAQKEARGGTATVVIIDEAARQWEFREIMAASAPMVNQIIAVTTAEIGNPGANAFLELLEEER